MYYSVPLQAFKYLADDAGLVKSFLSREDASAFAAGRDPPSMAKAKPDRFYGVAVGRKPGVYTEWAKAQEAIVGWKGPKYKKFETREAAEAFVRTYGAATSTLILSEADGEQQALEPPSKKQKQAEKPPPPRGNVLVVYTDGSSLGNGRSGASAGVGVYFGPNDPRCVFQIAFFRIKMVRCSPSCVQKCLGATGGPSPDEPEG
jgi:ribonuclease HI